MSARPLVAIDARMVHHSGIGVVLRRLFLTWKKCPPPFDLLLCGDPKKLDSAMPPGLEAEIVPWLAPIYSLSATLTAPRLPRRVAAWYSPHYATCLRPPAPMVCHIQDLLHLTHPSRRGTAAFLRFHLMVLKRKAVYTLVTTRHVKVQLQTLHGFSPEKVLLTSLGPGEVAEYTKEDPPFPKLPGYGEGDRFPYLVATGIFKPHKNWSFLLTRLADEKWRDYRLACAGLGGGEEALRALAWECGFDPDRLILPPYMAPGELTSLYRHARALVYPSLAEGFGFPLLEAMALGTPVVHANLSPMKEIAAGCGFPFDPDWPETFDAALGEALGEGPEAASRVEKGRREASHYSWEKTTALVNEAIQAAFEGRETHFPVTVPEGEAR